MKDKGSCTRNSIIALIPEGRKHVESEIKIGKHLLLRTIQGPADREDEDSYSDVETDRTEV